VALNKSDASDPILVYLMSNSRFALLNITQFQHAWIDGNHAVFGKVGILAHINRMTPDLHFRGDRGCDFFICLIAQRDYYWRE
jgi:hypothetical protein